MVSRPTFDPNDFAVRVSRDQWNKLVNDPDKPLLNKAIQAQLAPGSTFKIIMCAAGWQEHVAQDHACELAPEARISMDATLSAGSQRGHQLMSRLASTKRSISLAMCSSTRLANKLGIDRIAKYATDARLGAKDWD